MGEAKRHDNSNEQVKCAHVSCSRTSRTPKASGWGYMDHAPEEFPHWIGWWCPRCVKSLHRFMASQGNEPTIDRCSEALGAARFADAEHVGSGR
jgi:hypothetical protein